MKTGDRYEVDCVCSTPTERVIVTAPALGVVVHCAQCGREVVMETWQVTKSTKEQNKQ